jgi:hypothetical protein
MQADAVRCVLGKAIVAKGDDTMIELRPDFSDLSPRHSNRRTTLLSEARPGVFVRAWAAGYDVLVGSKACARTVREVPMRGGTVAAALTNLQRGLLVA